MVYNDFLKLSYLIVSEYYRNNLDPLFEYIDDNILWIGPAEKHLLRSKKRNARSVVKRKLEPYFLYGKRHGIPCIADAKVLQCDTDLSRLHVLSGRRHPYA